MIRVGARSIPNSDCGLLLDRYKTIDLNNIRRSYTLPVASASPSNRLRHQSGEYGAGPPKVTERPHSRLTPNPLAGTRRNQVSDDNQDGAQENQEEHFVVEVACARILNPEAQRGNPQHPENCGLPHTGLPAVKEEQQEA